MFIKKNLKARHLLLKVLFEHDQKFEPRADINSKDIDFDDICKKLPRYDRAFLLDNLDYLRSAEEIYCSVQFDKSTFSIYSSGSHSYRDKKYIRDGVKDQLNYIYDIAKTVSVIVLLAIAIWTSAQNIYQTKRNKTDIEDLRKDIRDINNKIGDTTKAAK